MTKEEYRKLRPVLLFLLGIAALCMAARVWA